MKLFLVAFCCLISIEVIPQSIDLELFASGLIKPVSIQAAGDNRLFVVELDGRIKIINSDGSLISEPFLDIDSKVIDISGLSERGFLGLAFHPNYQENGFFYVNYINNSNNTVISRFIRSDTNSADPASELILLTIDQPFNNHNGGNLAFGQDGYLYLALGDGGSSGDPQNNAQDLSTLLGKILRIDVDNMDSELNYAIPASNPYVNIAEARNEIWSYGLRNPWKFSFDRLTGAMWIADVGQNSFEEINLVPPSNEGYNFGWRCYEANNAFNLAGCDDPNTMIFPVAEYENGDRCSITGGYRYRGSSFPALTGLYFFADYCTSEIGTLTETGTGWDLQFHDSYPGNNWSSFGEDINGELYVAGIVSGSIFKIVDTEVLSLDETAFPNLKIYPNPVYDTLTLEFGIGIGNIINYEVYDLSSRLILSDQVEGDQKSILNLAELRSGLYILKAQTQSSRTITKKFLKI